MLSMSNYRRQFGLRVSHWGDLLWYMTMIDKCAENRSSLANVRKDDGCCIWGESKGRWQNAG
jgi:hypothetical protein